MSTDADQLPPPVSDPRRPNRFTSEVMAGGSVVELDDDELVGGWRGALGVAAIVALIALNVHLPCCICIQHILRPI